MKQLLLIIPEAIHSASSVIDVEISRENQRNNDDLTLGTSLRAYLRDAEDVLLGTSHLENFYTHVRAFLSKLVASTLKRLPFDDVVISDITCLDPPERLTSTAGMIRRSIDRFSNFVPQGKSDQIEEEFSLYQTTSDFILQTSRVDVFGGKSGNLQSSTGKPFGLLSNIAKCLLCIPHGNADSERMFSCINLIRTDHCNQLEASTIQACIDIKLNSTVTDCRVEPPQDVIKATRKVTPGSELAPRGTAPHPSFSKSSEHSYGTSLLS